MPASRPLLAILRRSALGAWLAVAYALAVLAASLAPAPALAAHPALAGAVLCSGAPIPDASEQPSPASPAQHCLGCIANSAVAIPPPPALPMALRFAVALERARQLDSEVRSAAIPGLPQSRAPPALS